jgi:asparagine synthase (glutamine-hydrolysing)
MCGIAGFVNLAGAPADVEVIRRMNDVQRHRGPDDQGLRLFSLAEGRSVEVPPGDHPSGTGLEGALGFNRLKILDLSDCGHQPMVNADGHIIIAFNGEIYNAFDYTRELEAAGFRFRSHTDTEVILYLYEKYGLDGMLSRLNGMFAIVIVDLRQGEIHIARDHFGIKPFYWAQVGSVVMFASEAKALLSHPDFRARLNVARLDEYLAFRFVAGADSLLEGVNQLPPGSCVRISRAGVTTRRYWQADDAPRTTMSDAEATDRLDQLLRASVKAQLLSDVKVGCQLSGGIDSSLVSVFARTHFDAEMEAFSIVFDDARYTEEAWIEQAAAAARAVSHRFTFTDDFFFDTLDRATWHMDQPMGHPNSLGIWLLARESRPSVTVLLSGEGADEVFGGYTRFFYAGLYPKVAPWTSMLRHIPGVGPRIERQFGADPVDSFITASQFQRPEALTELRPEADLEPVMARRRGIFAEGRGDHLGNCMRYEMQTYLVDLLVRQDKMTMAHSLENRVPFLDRDLVAFARQAPARTLVSPKFMRARARMRGTKVMLKNLARRSFDDRFVYRPKSGFSLPLADYMADRRFAALMEDRLLPGMHTRGLVDAEVVRRQWQGLAGQGQGAAEAVWIAVAFELWAQQFLDRPGAAVRGHA